MINSGLADISGARLTPSCFTGLKDNIFQENAGGMNIFYESFLNSFAGSNTKEYITA
jgi:hypothetical protein